MATKRDWKWLHLLFDFELLTGSEEFVINFDEATGYLNDFVLNNLCLFDLFVARV